MNMTYFYNYENFIIKRHNENVNLFLLKQSPSFERNEGYKIALTQNLSGATRCLKRTFY